MNLLFLRGLMQDPGSLKNFADRLRTHAPHLNVHTLDLPGVGSEYRRVSPLSITAIRIDLAKRFHERIAQKKWPIGPWMIAGAGIEAMVAVDWASAESDLFRKLILMNPSSADSSRLADRFRYRARFPMLFGLFGGDRPLAVRSYLGAVSNRYRSNDQKSKTIENDLVHSRHDRPPSPLTAFRHLVSASHFELPVDRPKAPTVVFASRGDRIAKPECAVRVAERLGASPIYHPWSGHDLTIDDPEWLARNVADQTENIE